VPSLLAVAKAVPSGANEASVTGPEWASIIRNSSFTSCELYDPLPFEFVNLIKLVA